MIANAVFGQFLLEFGKITPDTLLKALKIQSAERSPRLKTSSRLLGQILFEDFNAFESRVELNYWLQKFKDYKEYVENLHGELKIIEKRK